MNGGSDGVLRLLKRLSKAKGIFEKARQAKSKHEALKTSESVIQFLIKNLAPTNAMEVLEYA